MDNLSGNRLNREIERLTNQFLERASKEPYTYMERMEEILSFQEPDRLPINLQIHDHSAKISGVTVKEICTESKKLLYAQLYATEEYGLDAPRMRADAYSFEAEALGARMLYPKDSFPVILEPLVKEPKDLKELEIPDFHHDGRGPYYMENLRINVEKFGRYRLPACHTCAPWTLAVQLRGFRELVIDTRQRSTFVHKLLDFCNDIIEEFVRAQKEVIGEPVAPAMADAWACIPPISPKILYEYVIPHTTEIIERIGGAHWNGCNPIREIPGWEQILTDIVTLSGTTAGSVVMLESDWIDLKKVKNISDETKVPFIIGTRAELISKGTPREIEDYVRRAIRETVPGGGCTIYGDQIPRDTPPENIEGFVKAVKKYGRFTNTDSLCRL